MEGIRFVENFRKVNIFVTDDLKLFEFSKGEDEIKICSYIDRCNRYSDSDKWAFMSKIDNEYLYYGAFDGHAEFTFKYIDWCETNGNSHRFHEICDSLEEAFNFIKGEIDMYTEPYED